MNAIRERAHNDDRKRADRNLSEAVYSAKQPDGDVFTVVAIQSSSTESSFEC